MTSPCIHKTYTEDKALAKWYRLGKEKRSKFTIFQCPNCLGWRVLLNDTATRILKGDYEQEAKQPKDDKLPPDYATRLAITASRLPYTKKQLEASAKRLGCTVAEVREAFAGFVLAKRAKREAREQAQRFKASEKLRPKTPEKKNGNKPLFTQPEAPKPKRKFAKRPSRTIGALARELTKQQTEWLLTAEQWRGWFILQYVAREPKDKPTTASMLEAIRLLGPFSRLPEKIRLAIVQLGVIFPRTQFGRIPLTEALTWEKKGTGKTFLKCLYEHGSKCWPQRGEEYASATIEFVVEYDAKRDLRRKGMHFGKDGVRKKSQPHRVRTHDPNKPNRFRKFSTRSLKHYWRWLLAHLKAIAKAQGRLPENYVLPLSENLTADFDRSIRRTRSAHPMKGEDY